MPESESYRIIRSSSGNRYIVQTVEGELLAHLKNECALWVGEEMRIIEYLFGVRCWPGLAVDPEETLAQQVIYRINGSKTVSVPIGIYVPIEAHHEIIENRPNNKAAESTELT